MWVEHVGPPGYHPWWEVLGAVLPALLLGALIALLVWAVLRTTRGGPPPRGADAALEQLRYRYARGELGRDEFLRMWQDLGAPPPVPPPPSSPPGSDEPLS